jgi:uncharacterized membrane protein
MAQTSLVMKLRLTLASLSFGVALYWSFIRVSPPKTTVNATLIWGSPPFIAMLIAIPLLFEVGSQDIEKTKRSLTTPALQARHKKHCQCLLSALTATASFALVIFQIWLSFAQALMSDLKAYDPDNQDRMASGFEWVIRTFFASFTFAICMVLVFLAAIAPICCQEKCKAECRVVSLERSEEEVLCQICERKVVRRR